MKNINLHEKSVPETFKKNCIAIGYKKIDLKNLFFLVKRIGQRELKTSIYNTPHYFYALNVLNIDSKKRPTNVEDYILYNERVSKISYNKKFYKLIISWSNNYDYINYPILVRKDFGFSSSYVVLDGFHRSAILAAKGINKINVLIINPKFGYFTRRYMYLRKRVSEYLHK
jgi:hypothetical protein